MAANRKSQIDLPKTKLKIVVDLFFVLVLFLVRDM